MDSKPHIVESNILKEEPTVSLISAHPSLHTTETIMKMKLNKELGSKTDFISQETAKDLLFGQKGEKVRDQYETDFQEILLGDLIRRARKSRGMTQAQLGELINSDKSHISKIENNVRSARIETLVRIAEALNGQLFLSLELNS